MKEAGCPNCEKRLIAVHTPARRTERKCIQCEPIDPMRTDLAKWADARSQNLRPDRLLRRVHFELGSIGTAPGQAVS
jgi:hypothetical protein